MQTILKRPDEELIKQVYKCQKESPAPGDWCKLVNEDFDKINVHMTDAQIEAMSENDYMKIIKNKTRYACFNYLQALKESHEKVKINDYNNLRKPQEYVTSKILSNTEKSILFGLRSQTIGGFW